MTSAISQYEMASNRMLNVNDWHLYAGSVSAKFKLFDLDGNEVNRLAVEGDFFEIDIPGPASIRGRGKDWVQIKQIGSDETADEQLTFMRVRPTAPPFAPHSKPTHFLSNDASSTFLLYRQNVKVTAAVFGRNEVPNVQVPGWKDRIRNLVVAIGAFVGLSYTQWKSLIRGWLVS